MDMNKMTIDQLIAYIKQGQNHNFLYHFTDQSNLESIVKKGLLSKSTMKEQGMWPIFTGGDPISQKLDDERGISEYVSLCFTENHPMFYKAQNEQRLPNPKYLKINADVLKIPGVRVSFGIANSNKVKIMDLPHAIEHIDLEVIYSKTDWLDQNIQARLKCAEKMELLVPKLVPPSLIESELSSVEA